MEVSCKELRKRAWDKLANGRYGSSLGATVVYSILGSIGWIFTMGAMAYGVTDYFVSQQRGENPTIDNVFSGFNRYGDSLLSCFLQSVFLFLWSLLLVIPAIIKTYSYGLMYYVMRDFNLSGSDAITKSRELMHGYKWKRFVLGLSFIGWILLGLITFGIGLIFLAPYIFATEAEFYAEVLKCNGIEIGGNVENPSVSANDESATAVN